MKKFNLHSVLAFISLSFLFGACDNFDSSPKALVNIILVDTPAKWDSLFVEIEGVELEVLVPGRESADTETFYLEYKNGDKRIKVSELVGGNALLIGRNELPLGKVTKVTVKLGSNHSMFYEDDEYNLPLSDPSTQEVSLLAALDLDQGISYDMILDMDLEKSVVEVGTNSFALNPTFSLINGAITGKIGGALTPKNLYPAISLINKTDTLSTHLNTNGAYSFQVPEGDYLLYFDPKDDRYLDTAFNVKVIVGEDSLLNTISLKLKP